MKTIEDQIQALYLPNRQETMSEEWVYKAKNNKEIKVKIGMTVEIRFDGKTHKLKVVDYLGSKREEDVQLGDEWTFHNPKFLLNNSENRWPIMSGEQLSKGNVNLY